MNKRETWQNEITIVLVDDHTMMREGTRKLLEEDPELKVIGEAQDGASALPLCRSLRPSVIVLDIAMKGNNSETVRRCFPVIVLLLTQLEAPRVRSIP